MYIYITVNASKSPHSRVVGRYRLAIPAIPAAAFTLGDVGFP